MKEKFRETLHNFQSRIEKYLMFLIQILGRLRVFLFFFIEESRSKGKNIISNLTLTCL